MREASANSTRVRVISAISLTCSLPIPRLIQPRAGPTSSPVTVKNIGAVMLNRSSRPEVAA